MKKPEVTLENHEEVYRYYAQYKQPRVGAYIGHKVMSWMFRPQVEYAPGVQDALRDIIRNPNARGILAFNHLSDRDQYVVGAMAQRELVFRPMAGNTFIQSKEVLFHHPNPVLRPLLRHGVDIMGAVPAFRKKDVGSGKEDLRRIATNELIETSVDKLVGGQYMAGFPEGARNKDHPETVQELKSGFAVVAGKVAAANHEVGVIPIGFTYEGDSRRPHMWVGTPISDYTFDAAIFLPDLRDQIQDAVDHARYSAGTA